ncbi:MAG: hypothetical protein M3Y77_10630 [Actinomycetota bacterium]|nr:hypothetical protein [Actinomycetota bacterium]MDQ2846782.1 hypothetical protein [Actinomycetota bacterium]MDQ2958201.1 hypothetical protein [Actinomycetota bacterium]
MIKLPLLALAVCATATLTIAPAASASPPLQTVPAGIGCEQVSYAPHENMDCYFEWTGGVSPVTVTLSSGQLLSVQDNSPNPGYASAFRSCGGQSQIVATITDATEASVTETASTLCIAKNW